MSAVAILGPPSRSRKRRLVLSVPRECLESAQSGVPRVSQAICVGDVAPCWPRTRATSMDVVFDECRPGRCWSPPSRQSTCLEWGSLSAGTTRQKSGWTHGHRSKWDVSCHARMGVVFLRNHSTHPPIPKTAGCGRSTIGARAMHGAPAASSKMTESRSCILLWKPLLLDR